MKQFSYIEDLADKVGKEVSLRGWVYSLRKSKKVKFLSVRDGSGIIQCVFTENDSSKEVFDAVDELDQETSLEVTGQVQQGRNDVEILATSFKVIHASQSYPITPKEHGVDFLMSHRHLWLRSKKQHAALRVRHEVIKSIRDFFDSRNFTLVDSPIFTPNSCEGTSDLFETAYFDKKVFLSQTGQLYLEAAAAAFGRAYCFGPTFRAEKSKTRKHLIEFWMVEPEVAFMNMDEAIELSEHLVRYIVEQVLKNKQKELSVLERDMSELEKIKKPFEKIHYKEACEIVKKHNPDFKTGDNLGSQDEIFIVDHFKKPVFVHHFPTAQKAFYMKECPEDKEFSLSFDLLAPESYGEIIGGGQRKDDHDSLVAALKRDKLDMEPFQWYLDLRKYGSFTHSGFGLGVERTVSWICGLAHVRESIPFPRLYGRVEP